MSEEKLIQEIYDLTLQNNTARELDEAFKQGIEETIAHLKELNLLRLHDVSDMFSFSAYLECYYSYWDNTELGDIYTSNTTGKEFTTKQIYCKWLKWK